jgi:hypothetical protein
MNKSFFNIKIFFVLLIFILAFSFLGSPAKAQDCSSICGDCGDQVSCNGSTAKCAWDSGKSKCCREMELYWPPSPMGTQLASCSAVTEMVKYFYEWGISLGGFIAFIALVIAGFGYLTSAGNPIKMKEAQSRMTDAAVGLIILLVAFIALTFINPELTSLKVPQVVIPGSALDSVPPAIPPDMNKNCTKVIIWTGLNCSGTKEATFLPTSACNNKFIDVNENYSMQVVCSTTAAGVEITCGICEVPVYSVTGCTNQDSLMTTFYSGCINFKNSYLKSNIQSLKINEMF